MTAIKRQDERGRWTVRYFDGSYVGTYTAESEDDATDFATSPERQQADHAFAALKFRERIK